MFLQRCDKVGGHCQNLYHDTFASILRKGFEQIVGTITMFSKLWCRVELLFSAFRISNGSSVSETVRDATTEMYELSWIQEIVADFWDWFR